MSGFAAFCVIAGLVVLLVAFGLGVRVGFRAGAALPGSSPSSAPGRVWRPGKDPAPEKDLTWRRTAVYLYFDRRGFLLYVGIARDPGKRARQHAGLDTEPMKVWWPQVDPDATQAWWLPNRIAACCVEWSLIHYLRPPHNTAPGSSDDAYCLDQPPIVAAAFEVPSTGLAARVRRSVRR